MNRFAPLIFAAAAFVGTPAIAATYSAKRGSRCQMCGSYTVLNRRVNGARRPIRPIKDQGS